MQQKKLGGLKLFILSFLETFWETEAFYHKTENQVSSANPIRITTRCYFVLFGYHLILRTLMYQYRIHKTIISKIIQEVCTAIYKVTTDLLVLSFKYRRVAKNCWEKISTPELTKLFWCSRR